jgi:cyclophilin family peptidyl-prolyl cis-trans isomerase
MHSAPLYFRFSLFGAIFGAIFLFSCGEKTATALQKEALEINFNDAVVQQIVALRSKRDANGAPDLETLRTYLALDNPNHRYAAVWVAAALQDSNMISDLGKMLRDEQVSTRIMAAFALGQTQSPRAAEVLSAAFQQDTIREVQAAILEAVGRCGSAEQLRYLATVRPYPLKDTLLLEGLALGIYRYAVRGMVYNEGTEKVMNDFISNARMPPSVRFISANYLARMSNIDVSSYEDVLLNAVRTEKDPNTLMFWVIGLAKTQTQQAYTQLISTYDQTTDYRVKCNIIRALQYFKYDSTKVFIYNAMQDSVNPHVPLVAAEHFYRTGRDLDALQYLTWANAAKDWQVQIMLQSAALRHLAPFKIPSKNFISQKLIEQYKNSSQPYQKALILRALGNYTWNYQFLSRELLPLNDSLRLTPLLQSSCAEALAEIRSSDDFDKVLGINRPRVVDELNAIFRQCIEKGDVGVQAVIGTMLVNPKLNFKAAYPDYSFIKTARNALRLPTDLETWAILGQTIDYFNGKDITTGYNPPTYKNTQLIQPDWQIIKNINPQTTATIETSRGNITLTFSPLAPATVSHFVQLANAGFYNNKTFHRVVTNFVVQGGCPRGDGWGGSELCVPSELSPAKYWEAGCVGMASAGKDTEGTQFFITHAPTVHLDGNYTMFAKVSNGIDVVHQLQLGDTIRTVRINTK